MSVSGAGNVAPLYIILNRMAYGKQDGDIRPFHAHPLAEGISAMPRWGRARGVVKRFTAAMASRRDLGRTKAKFHVIILDLMRRRARRSASSLLRPTEPSSRVSAALVPMTGPGRTGEPERVLYRHEGHQDGGPGGCERACAARPEWWACVSRAAGAKAAGGLREPVVYAV